MYTRREVKGLVDNYAELKGRRDTTPGFPLFLLLALVDLDRAIANLPPKEYQAILLHGLLRQTVRGAAAGLLGVSPTTLYERYESGLEWITDFLNGATA